MVVGGLLLLPRGVLPLFADVGVDVDGSGGGVAAAAVASEGIWRVFNWTM